jgi:hypothetical protein
MDNEPPLVKGGQGRTGGSLISGAHWLIILGLSAVGWAIVYGIYCLFN